MIRRDLFGPVPGRYPQTPGYKAGGTSRDAARSIASHAKGIRGVVLKTFREAHPAGMTADEIGKRLGISLFTVRPRVSELHADELIEPTPERRKNESGHGAVVWRASVKAMGAANE